MSREMFPRKIAMFSKTLLRESGWDFVYEKCNWNAREQIIQNISGIIWVYHFEYLHIIECSQEWSSLNGVVAVLAKNEIIEIMVDECQKIPRI